MVVLFQLLTGLSVAADVKPALTQKDFVLAMFKQFQWESGLPEKPTDRDFLQILGGRRTFRYEAENAYTPKTDRVSLNTKNVFGPFTGKGWLAGISDKTMAHFTILLPMAGEYNLKAVIKGDGFVWSAADKKYVADSKSPQFREVEIGKMVLKAGITKLEVTIPPEGAIDAFSLVAADHPPIQPLKGWRLKENLNAGSLAEIVVSMAGLQAGLPRSPDGAAQVLSADGLTARDPNIQRTDSAYLGKFSSRQWLRANVHGAAVQLPLKIAETGYHDITMNIMGGAVSGTVNDVPFRLTAKPYLEPVAVGLYRLEAGDNTIQVNLPPMGGLDTVTLTRRSSAADEFLKLAGVKGPADRLIPEHEAVSLLQSIRERYPVRK